jgi:hypothetical protein
MTATPDPVRALFEQMTESLDANKDVSEARSKIIQIAERLGAGPMDLADIEMVLAVEYEPAISQVAVDVIWHWAEGQGWFREHPAKAGKRSKPAT